MAPGRTIWSVGHSNHELPRLVSILQGHHIDVVADLRSSPFSRYRPHFNREPLKAALERAGVAYVFLGESLGGRPPEPELYDAEGHVLYGEQAETDRFLGGLERLLEGAAKFRVAMLCSEEDPSSCHRHLLVARVLRERGVSVLHIRGDESVVADDEIAAPAAPVSQGALFGEEPPAWRSIRSVSRSTQPASSSRS